MKNEGFFRRNSSCLIDRKLLIDPGAHIFSFIEDFDMLDLFDDITDIIVTHIHSDHVKRESVLRLAENKKLRIGCDRRCAEHIGKNQNITYTLFKPYMEYNVGDKDDWKLFEHNTIPMIRKMVDAINAEKLMKEDGKLIASHFGRTLHGNHDEISSILKKINMTAAYDGMKVTL